MSGGKSAPHCVEAAFHAALNKLNGATPDEHAMVAVALLSSVLSRMSAADRRCMMIVLNTTLTNLAAQIDKRDILGGPMAGRA